jgi:SAM-dependent methyltransferase
VPFAEPTLQYSAEVTLVVRALLAKFRYVIAWAVPYNSDRRLVLLLAETALREPWRLPQRLNYRNVALWRVLRRVQFRCNVCGHVGAALYRMPDLGRAKQQRIAILRETMRCRGCNSSMRDRTLAAALLQVLAANYGVRAETVHSLAGRLPETLSIYDTDSHSQLSRELSRELGYVRSEYVPGLANGLELEPGHLYNMDLQEIIFADDSFDIILSSEVMEHVREPAKAHSEIARCLRRGGFYVFTVPYDDSLNLHHVLVDSHGPTDLPLEPPHLHGDPIRGRILSYRIFGRQLINDLAEVGLDASFRRVSAPDAGVFNGDVFVARRS